MTGKARKILDDFNRATLDEGTGPVAGGGDQEMKVLKEMNEPEDFRNEAMK